MSGYVVEHPVEQPGLERQSSELIDKVVGVGSRNSVVRRADECVAQVRSAGDHGVPVNSDRGSSLPRRRSEQMDPARILLPRPNARARAQWLRALRHPAQTRLYVAPGVESVQPLCPCAQLGRRLIAPEQQHREERPLIRVEPEPSSRIW